MRHVLATVVLTGVVGCGAVAEQGSGHIVTENRDVSGFDSVEVCCGMDVTIKQGSSHSVVVRGDDNIIEHIDTEVRGRTLVIDYSGHSTSFRPTQPIVVKVGATDIARVSASGGSEISVQRLNGRDLEIDLSGGSRLVAAELTGRNLNVDLSGASAVELSGAVKRQMIDASGGSWYHAADLESRSAEIHASGGSDAVIWTTEALDVDLSGGSEVDYSGSPTVTQATSGGSVVSAR